MKRFIHFNKAFIPAALVSLALVAFSMVGLFVRGFNMGVDFKAGEKQTVQLAYRAGTVTYTGSGQPQLEISATALTVVFSGAEVENKTVVRNLKDAGTMQQLADSLRADGIAMSIIPEAAGLPAALLVPTYQGDTNLSGSTLTLYRMPRDENERFGSVALVNEAVSGVGSVAVTNVGKPENMQYMIRVSDDGTDKNFSQNIRVKLQNALKEAFTGNQAVVFMQSDYVGSRFSKALADKAWLLILVTGGIILIYATIRFKIQYAIGAVLAITHDAFIMMGFMIWSNMEFNIISIAAILTILGYSINDTIVIFDRIREDHKLSPTDSMVTILNRSISETLSRTVITTITTLLAVFALYFLTSGSIKDFALALIVGMISGTYSTIFIATAFVRFWDFLKNRKTAVKPKVA